MKKSIKYLFGILAFAVVSSCSVDEVVDPNNPSLGSVTSNPSKAELQVLITGMEARGRAYYGNATQMFGSFGREIWAFFGSDPRFISQWLGVGLAGQTDPDFFASGGTYVTPYLAVKQANVLIEATDVALQAGTLTQAEANGYFGFARTFKAYQLLFPWLQQWDNGIRVDVEDPLNPGPILGRQQALTEIRNLLDQANTELSGGEFAFSLTAGFDGFNTAATFNLVNRAIAARVALYDGDFDAAYAAANSSFLNETPASADDMNVGPQHVYGDAPDINNPMFYPLNAATSTIVVVHPAMVEEALPGDLRVANKFFLRDEPATNSGVAFPGDYQDQRYATNTTPIPFIRNEELILIKAEAAAFKAAPDLVESENLLNVVRNMWGVGNYGGASTANDLLDDILFQRRYSLWAEGGHRWIDLRRLGRLSGTDPLTGLPYIDLRDGGSVFTQVAPRTSETTFGN